VPTPSNPITLDTYFIVTPASEFISKSYANLNGVDLFFYVNETNSLRVVNFNTNQVGNTSFVLAQDVVFVGSISLAGVIHVYYADINGQLWYFPYVTLGATVVPVALAISGVVTFSICYTPQSTPPNAFMLLVDNGLDHIVYAATNPTFTSLISTTTVFNNAFNPNLYITLPKAAVHPLDTDVLTIHVQQITVESDTNQTGFYAVQVPGVS
jgi:hypothetical protein